MHHAAPPVGRNEPCPCGSGEKYKNCCAKSLPAAGSRWSSPYAILALVALFAFAGYLVGVKRKPPAEPSTTVLSTPGNLTPVAPAMPQPGTLPPVTATPAPFTPGPQPPGPVPPGKVWSPEHGHWHDITPPVGTTTQPIELNPAGGNAPIQVTPAPFTPGPQPPGPVPPGKVWSEEHGHWHDLAPQASTPATTTPIEITPTTPPSN